MTFDSVAWNLAQAEAAANMLRDRLRQAEAEIKRLRAGFNEASELVVKRDLQNIELTLDKNALLAELEREDAD